MHAPASKPVSTQLKTASHAAPPSHASGTHISPSQLRICPQGTRGRSRPRPRLLAVEGLLTRRVSEVYG